MSPQKKMMTTKPAKSARPVSMIEPLEGRQLFSASPALDGGAVMTDANVAKVTASDFSFTTRLNKSSPKLATTALKVTFKDILISS